MFMKDFTRQLPKATPVLPAMQTGMAAGTMVETQDGWRRIEALRMGDKVQTLDGGLARVVGLRRQAVADGRLMHVPAGHLGTCEDLWLAPFQHVLVDTLGDAAFPDAANLLLPAMALEGTVGRLRPTPFRAEVVTPLFAEDEVVWANSGALVWCPGLSHDPAEAPATACFTSLSAAEARAWLTTRVCCAL
jgi:hypothetical protein